MRVNQLYQLQIVTTISGTTVVHNLYKIFPMSITRHCLVNDATQSARALMMLQMEGQEGFVHSHDTNSVVTNCPGESVEHIISVEALGRTTMVAISCIRGYAFQTALRTCVIYLQTNIISQQGREFSLSLPFTIHILHLLYLQYLFELESRLR